MNANKNFRDNVRTAMDQSGLSLRKLEAKCGITFSSISRILRGHVDPSISTAERIAEAVDTPLSDLFLHPADFKIRRSEKILN